jgi:Multiubiquitin
MPAEAKTTTRFFVNGHKVETDEKELTGAAIKALGEVPAGEVLYLREQGTERRIEDDSVVELKNGMQFVSAPDGNVS